MNGAVKKKRKEQEDSVPSCVTQAVISSYFKKPEKARRVDEESKEFSVSQESSNISLFDSADLPAKIQEEDRDNNVQDNLNDMFVTKQPGMNHSSDGYSSENESQNRIRSSEDIETTSHSLEVSPNFLKKYMRDTNKNRISTQNTANSDLRGKLSLTKGNGLSKDKLDILSVGYSSPKSEIQGVKGNPTQLEQQFMNIKSQYPDCLLIIEVGYKYRFFDQDAFLAAKELNIVAYLDCTLYTASIPTHRLEVHLRKLIQAGHKVGLVQQVETAALKANSLNKGGLFERKLTRIYTKGTFIDDITYKKDRENDTNGELGYILYISESKTYSTQNSTTCIVAVSVSFGYIIFDEFEDTPMKDELRTRLIHFKPTEIVLSPKKLNIDTLKFIEAFASSEIYTGTRIELNDSAYQLDVNNSKKYFIEQYKTELKNQNNGSEMGSLISRINSLPENVFVCMSAMLRHLTDFGLERVAFIPEIFSSFSSINHMVLSADTIESLDIYTNRSNSLGKNSLFSVLNRTRTASGQRLLKRWLLNPLIIKNEIVDRLDATEELREKDLSDELEPIKNILPSFTDLENSICKIYYSRCAPIELYNTLISLNKLICAVSQIGEPFTSKIIKNALESINSIRNIVPEFLRRINPVSASKNSKLDFFNDTSEWPEIERHRDDMRKINAELDYHLLDIKKQININVNYTTISGTSHLVELPINMVSRVPLNWIKISQTKTSARFHTPVIIEKLKSLELYNEKLSAEFDYAYKEFLIIVSKHYKILKRASDGISIIDCIISLAETSKAMNYTRPEISDNTEICALEARNPIVENYVSAYMANDINLDAEKRALLITGPNMGGKSSYIRQIAHIVIMAQVGSFVPAKVARVGIFDSVFTRMGASDNIMGGESTFMKEMSETSSIIRASTDKSLIIIDELGRGTSTYDGTAIANAVLAYLVQEKMCIVLFVTHYTSIGRLEKIFPENISCSHMGFVEEQGKRDSHDVKIIFLYKILKGLAKKSYGLNVARLAGLPSEIISRASILSQQIFEETEIRSLNVRLLKKLQLFNEVFSSPSSIEIFTKMIENFNEIC